MKICTQCKARFTGSPTRCPLDGAPLLEQPDPLLGRSIGGRYRVEGKIGAGGMASVYRASYELLGRKVAIKFLSPDLALDATQRQRFLREARATNRIKHEHIVDITDYGEEDRTLVYLVMELLEGEPLSHRIARGALAPRTAIDIIRQTALALARAHELEVIHRDLKPENIFLTVRDGKRHVKLLDFGLAHVRNETRLTALGAVFGTPEYMSPEQARGAPVGPASDLYSLGVVFFEMVTQQLPFEGSTAELIVKHLKEVAPPASSRNPRLPREVDQIVAKMLEKDPTQRYRDAHHLIDALDGVLEHLPDGPDRRASVERAALRIQRLPEPPAVTAPVSLLAWQKRRDVYNQAFATAYEGRPLPAWVRASLGQLEGVLQSAATLEIQLADATRGLAERERSIAEARHRIGRALDELTRDESASVRIVAELERNVEQLRSHAARLASAFQLAWEEARERVSPEGWLVDVTAAHAVEEAARHAGAWRDQIERVTAEEAVLRGRRVAGDDLRFQVTELKHRLAASDAEFDAELQGMREGIARLGASLAKANESLGELGSVLAAHLMEFPAARPLVASQAPATSR